MNKIMKKLLVFFATVMITLFSAGIAVMAEHWHGEEEEGTRSFYEEHEEYEENHEFDGYKDDDEDDDELYEEGDEYGDGYDTQQTTQSQTGYWNIWIREAIASQDSDLPISQPGEVIIKVNDVSSNIHVVPQEGQLFVSGEQVAKLLNVKSTFFPKSQILVISNKQTELIVRAGSNAAYENKNKTPMPIQAQYIEKSLYLPISVITNALGYRVTWDETQQSLILESI